MNVFWDKRVLICAALLALVTLGVAGICLKRHQGVSLDYCEERNLGYGLSLGYEQGIGLVPGMTPREALARIVARYPDMHVTELRRCHKRSLSLSHAAEKVYNCSLYLGYTTKGSDPFEIPPVGTLRWFGMISNRENLSLPLTISDAGLDVPLDDGDVLFVLHRR